MPRPSELLASPFDFAYPADLDTEWIDVMDYAVPLWVADPEDEYAAFRSRVGLLEYSMLYRWNLRGPGAVATADAIFSRNVSAMQPGSIAYGVVTNDDGRMVDDPTVAYYSPEHVLLVGGSPEVGELLRRHAVGDVRVEEERKQHFVLSVQGPRSRELLSRVTDIDMSNEAFPYYTFRTDVAVCGIPCQVNRIGFTAELGFEVIGPVERAGEVLSGLQSAGSDLGATMCGAAALMMCRIESGMVMAHLEYDETSTPYDCRLGWAVDLGKGPFLGRESLVQHKSSAAERVVTIRVDGSPEGLDEMPVLVRGDRVGVVTMAVPSPHLAGATIAMARIAKEHSSPGTQIEISAVDALRAAEVLTTPVYDPERLRVRS